MEQIEIIKRDGSVIKCFCPEPFCTPTQAVQEKSLMSDDTVKITLRTTQPYLFGKGDRVVINGETYKIRTTQERQLQTEDDYIHTLTFYGVMYDLMKCQYRNCDANGNSTKAIFDLTYSIKDFVKVAIYNLNRDNPGEWAFDEQNCPDTEPITVSFSKSNVLQVIQDLCSKDKFNLEFRITTTNGVNTIHIGQFGEVVTPPSGADYFEYGKGNGLWQLKERKVDDKAIITRLWAEGGSQNIKSGYRDYSDRIQFPYPQRVNARQHKLKDGTVIPAGSQTIGITDDAKRYMEDVAMSQAMGVEEDTQTFDDIYPKRTGEVTALGGSVLEFVDNTMDFDLNEKDSEGNTKYLIDGTSAKLTFITGKLAGQEFELSKYTHGTKTFKLIAYTDERGLKIPTEDTDAFRFVVGDKYKLTDINMPDSYVQAAEEDLWYAALDYFNEAKQARCQYELTFDRSYFLENMPEDSDTCLFKVGDYVPVKDTRFGIQKNIRIQKVSRNLLLEHDYTLTLSDTTAISVVAQSVLDVIEHEKIIQINDLRNLTKAKRGWRTTEELRNMVYDTDGYFDNENIRPNSIDTNMLTVGSKSQQFVLSGVVLAANVGGNPNNFVASSGVLSHLTIQEDGVRVWNMAAQDVTLSQSGGYYVFAKCSKTGSNGVWFVTQEQLKVEPASDPNNYYFQVGIIGSLAEGGTFRDFTSTYGFTRINGNTITTGRIVTADGESYLDLDGNLFRIGDSYSSVTLSNSGNRKKVTLKNVDVVSGAGDPVALGVPRGTYSNTYTYYPNDTVQYTVGTSTATYRYINANPSSGHLPTDSTYWAIEAKGADGGQGASAYFHIKYAAVANPTDSQMKDIPDKYIGTCTDTNPTAPTTASSYTWAQFRGQDGTSITISSREIKYVRSNDGVNAPGSSAAWQTAVPAEDPNKPYLWTRTTVTYSDQQSTTSYSVSRVGKDGSSVTITSREINYAKGTDGSTIPTAWKNWGEITFEAGDYMWTRTTVTYSDGQSTVAYSVSRIGADGERGYPGAPGEDGRTTYLHLKYSNDGGLTFTDNNGETPGSYMGQYTDFEEWDSSNPADYTWALIEGASGVGGSNGEVEPFYEFRFAKNGSRLTPPALEQTNPNPTGWSTVQPSVAALEYLWQTVAQKSALGQKALFHIPVNSGESGTLADASGHGKNITLGSGSVVASVGGRTALSMPGNALATMVNLLPFGENFTLCFWVRTDQSYIDWCLNGKWGVSSVEKRLAMGQNVWTHVALRFTEKSLTVFKDGALVDTASLSERVVGFSMYDDNMFGSAIYLDDIWCLSGALADADIVKVKDGNTDALVTAWSTPVRVTPYDGKDGANGKSPAAIYRGVWSAGKYYYGTDVRVDVVKYNGSYWVAAIDAGTFIAETPSSSSTKWNSFGAEFESVATALLFAQLAYVDNLGVRNLRTIETNSKRVEITSADNAVKVINSSEKTLIKLDGEDSSLKTYDTDGTVRLKMDGNNQRLSAFDSSGNEVLQVCGTNIDGQPGDLGNQSTIQFGNWIHEYYGDYDVDEDVSQNANMPEDPIFGEGMLQLYQYKNPQYTYGQKGHRYSSAMCSCKIPEGGRIQLSFSFGSVNGHPSPEHSGPGSWNDSMLFHKQLRCTLKLNGTTIAYSQKDSFRRTPDINWSVYDYNINDGLTVSIDQQVSQGGLLELYITCEYNTAYSFYYRYNGGVMPTGAQIDNGWDENYVDFGGSRVSLTHTASIAITKIGTNGLYSAWSAVKYLFYNQNFGLEARADGYGIRVTTSGVWIRLGGTWYSCSRNSDGTLKLTASS